MAHTKGPWSAIEAQRGFIVTAIDGFYDIAVVRNMGNEDNKANARLIAAAPDLLEALQHAVDWLNAAGIAETMPVQLQARAAIKKATQ